MPIKKNWAAPPSASVAAPTKEPVKKDWLSSIISMPVDGAKEAWSGVTDLYDAVDKEDSLKGLFTPAGAKGATKIMRGTQTALTPVAVAAIPAVSMYAASKGVPIATIGKDLAKALAFGYVGGEVVGQGGKKLVEMAGGAPEYQELALESGRLGGSSLGAAIGTSLFRKAASSTPQQLNNISQGVQDELARRVASRDSQAGLVQTPSKWGEMVDSGKKKYQSNLIDTMGPVMSKLKKAHTEKEWAKGPTTDLEVEEKVLIPLLDAENKLRQVRSPDPATQQLLNKTGVTDALPTIDPSKGESLEHFGQYLIAKRELTDYQRALAAGKPYNPPERFNPQGGSKATAEIIQDNLKLVKELEPIYFDRATKVWSLMDEYAKRRLKAGLISKNSYDALRNSNPYHVPNKPATSPDEDDLALYLAGGRTPLNPFAGKPNSTVLKHQANTLERETLNPLDLLGQHGMKTNQESAMNELAQSMVQVAMPVTKQGFPARPALGYEVPGWKAYPIGEPPPKGVPGIELKQNGVKQFLEMPLEDAIHIQKTGEVNPYTVTGLGIGLRAMRSALRMRKMAMTGPFNPRYAIAVAPMRDVSTSLMNARDGKQALQYLMDLPGAAAYMAAKQVGKDKSPVMRGITSKLAPYFDDMVEGGVAGKYAETLRSTSQHSAGAIASNNSLGSKIRFAFTDPVKEVTKLVKGQPYNTKTIKQPLEAASQLWEGAENFFGVWEETNRLANYRSSYDSAIKRGLSPDNAKKLAQFDAANSTTDFSRRGALAIYAEMFEPYFNANHQGLWSAYHYATEPSKGSVKGINPNYLGKMGVALAPRLSLLLYNYSDPIRAELYSSIDSRTRTTSAIYVDPKGDVDDKGRVKATRFDVLVPEPAYPAIAAMEAAFEGWHKNKNLSPSLLQDAAGEWFKSLTETVFPYDSFLHPSKALSNIPIIGPAGQAAAGVDLQHGGDIFTKSRQSRAIANPAIALLAASQGMTPQEWAEANPGLATRAQFFVESMAPSSAYLQSYLSKGLDQTLARDLADRVGTDARVWVRGPEVEANKRKRIYSRTKTERKAINE